jgi:hypothetical protein
MAAAQGLVNSLCDPRGQQVVLLVAAQKPLCELSLYAVGEGKGQGFRFRPVQEVATRCLLAGTDTVARIARLLASAVS